MVPVASNCNPFVSAVAATCWTKLQLQNWKPGSLEVGCSSRLGWSCSALKGWKGSWLYLDLLGAAPGSRTTPPKAQDVKKVYGGHKHKCLEKESQGGTLLGDMEEYWLAWLDLRKKIGKEHIQQG
eukprot:1150707-Pelagomonas_calceolata.AAC.2